MLLYIALILTDWTFAIKDILYTLYSLLSSSILSTWRARRRWSFVMESSTCRVYTSVRRGGRGLHFNLEVQPWEVRSVYRVRVIFPIEEVFQRCSYSTSEDEAIFSVNSKIIEDVLHVSYIFNVHLWYKM